MKKIIKFLITNIIIVLILIISINSYVIITTKNKIINSNTSIETSDCIIVLGAGLRNDKPSLMLEDRLKKGIEVYNNGISNKIIMSGDHTKENHDEVNIMKEYAINNNVPSEDIFMDHAGISTYDSIYRAKNIFNAKKIVIITQKYHTLNFEGSFSSADIIFSSHLRSVVLAPAIPQAVLTTDFDILRI